MVAYSKEEHALAWNGSKTWFNHCSLRIKNMVSL